MHRNEEVSSGFWLGKQPLIGMILQFKEKRNTNSRWLVDLASNLGFLNFRWERTELAPDLPCQHHPYWRLLPKTVIGGGRPPPQLENGREAGKLLDLCEAGPS